MGDHFWNRRPTIAIELTIIGACAVLLFFVSGTFNFFEFLYKEVRIYDAWQFDELFVVFVFLSVAFCIFGMRRWREAAALLQERELSMVELRKSKKAAEEASHAKGQFLANMSHEIRTPMNAIIGMTELTLDTDLTDEQQEYLKLVQISSKSLLQLLNDILDFSKIEAGKLELDRSEFSFRKTLSDTMKSLGLRAQEKGIELAFHVASGVPDDLVGDSLRLRQVLVNLVGNAIKFTEQGEVVVSVESEPVSDREVRTLISVRDTGVGIPAEQQQKIFEVFTQADGSATRRFTGSGLGLAITSSLVQMMGGHIWVESVPKQGSVFHFTAEFALDKGEAPKQSVTQLDLAGYRVLIVDDNSTNRVILGEAVSKWQMQSSSVDSGRAGLDAMQRAVRAGEPFDLVLLDAMMPGMDGFEVAERIRDQANLAGATIMMLSSADSDDDAARCRELGIAVYLRKPVVESELRDAVLVALGRQQHKRSLPSQPSAAEDEVPSRPLNILLAEDNIVNQKVTLGVLKKRRHEVVAVNNGREVLEALACQRFDLVLMDVQMPEMDGLETTAAIRRKERKFGGHVPIIALTAHAMKGDRERCIEAGMDDYLSKPVEPAALREIVARWASSKGLRNSPQDEMLPLVRTQCSRASNSAPAYSDDAAIMQVKPAAVHGDHADVFDQATFLARVEEDLDLLVEMVDLYLTHAPPVFDEIESAVAARDGKKLASAAHTCKGMLKNMCAPRCVDAALDLERIGKTNNFVEADRSLNKLQDEVERLRVVLTEVAKGVSI
jgi:two-component system, sensor histidine kinase and response regulator